MLRVLVALVVVVVPAVAQQVQLPAVPSFEVPPSEPGFTNPKELRVRGRKLLDTDVKVKGYLIWIYNCLDAVIQPGESRRAAQRRIDDDPTQCERMKFYLGASKTDPPERGLWIVDVPRPPNKLERERLPREELAKWPKPPKLKVGDYVIVSGKFTLSSPHSERNSDGLVVFAGIQAAKPAKSKPAGAWTPPPRPVVAAPQVTVVTINPANDAARQRSVKLANEGTRAFDAKLHTEAQAAYTKAIAEWPGNHVAHYGLGGVHGTLKNWQAARDEAWKAVELQPKQPMYKLLYGTMAYEAAMADAREAQARREGKKPDEVIIDPTTINHDKALSFLDEVSKLDPTIWRAHYYMGRIYRDRGDAYFAAEAFTAALRLNADDPGPWIALGELYRQWDHPDEAIAVATLGTTVVPKDASDVWYVLGMAYEDKLDHKRAVEAFTKSLDLKPDNGRTMFQRGQAQFRLGDFAKAKIDLEAFLKSGASVEFAKQQASKLLMEIAAKKTK